MLEIRREQMRVFENLAFESWVNRMTESNARNYPRQFAAMGRSGARNFVLRAIEKGRVNHVETQGGVAILAELMIQFGEDFERSPDKSWAGEILGHPTLPAQLKMQLLYRRMTELSHGRVIVPFPILEEAGA
jgi:hypothetical protein